MEGTFDLERLPPDAALAITARLWLEQIAVRDFDAVALAPPVLEVFVGGELAERRMVTFGAEYDLSPVALD